MPSVSTAETYSVSPSGEKVRCSGPWRARASRQAPPLPLLLQQASTPVRGVSSPCVAVPLRSMSKMPTEWLKRPSGVELVAVLGDRQVDDAGDERFLGAVLGAPVVVVGDAARPRQRPVGRVAVERDDAGVAVGGDVDRQAVRADDDRGRVDDAVGHAAVRGVAEDVGEAALDGRRAGVVELLERAAVEVAAVRGQGAVEAVAPDGVDVLAVRADGDAARVLEAVHVTALVADRLLGDASVGLGHRGEGPADGRGRGGRRHRGSAEQRDEHDDRSQLPARGHSRLPCVNAVTHWSRDLSARAHISCPFAAFPSVARHGLADRGK